MFCRRNLMITKDVKAMLSYSFSYADEIGWKKNGAYPRDAKLSLRNQLKDDLLVFLGYLYDEDSSNLPEQIAFINDSLQITITPENFMRFINDKCKAPDLLTRVPLSLHYFVKDDISPYTRRQGYGIALSRYLLNTFNDVGCYFIAFNGVSDLEAQRLSEYIGVMNEYVASYGLFEKPKGEDPRDAMRREEDEKARSRYRSNEFNEDRMNGLGMSINQLDVAHFNPLFITADHSLIGATTKDAVDPNPTETTITDATLITNYAPNTSAALQALIVGEYLTPEELSTLMRAADLLKQSFCAV